MASILWSLSYALPSAPSSFIGPSSLASLGLARPRRRLVSQGTSTLSFRRAGAAVDAAYLFPWGTIVKMFRNGVPWFYGVVTQTPSAGSGRAEDQDYVVSDPWWYLENLVYQQQWIAPSYPGANTTNDPYRSHCFLNKWIFNALSNNFTRETTDQQIADVIAYAQSAPSNDPASFHARHGSLDGHPPGGNPGRHLRRCPPEATPMDARCRHLVRLLHDAPDPEHSAPRQSCPCQCAVSHPGLALAARGIRGRSLLRSLS
jgi:hypothetical protein